MKLDFLNQISNILNSKKFQLFFEIIFWISIAVLIMTIILLKPLNDLDEIWVYNNSKNIIEGRLPYKDFSIITMPLVPYLGSVFLLIFNNELFSMRIFAIILSFLLLFTFDKIIKKVNIDKNISKLIILAMIYIFTNHFRIDYNFFNLFLILIIIYTEIKNIENKSSKVDILLGVLAGICICCKQTTGICIAIVTLFYNIIFIKDKKTLKNIIKKVFHRIIGFSIVVGLLCTYFGINNLWNDFENYAIFGIKQFTNKIIYTKLITNGKWYIKVISCIVPMYLIVDLINVIARKILRKDLDIKETIFLAYSWASISVAFPISDEVHFLVGAFPSIIGITYIIYTKIIKSNKKLILVETIVQVLTIYIIVLAVINLNVLLKFFINIDKNKEINHFHNIPNTMYLRINEIDKYIQSQDCKVYILDASAALYMIPIDRYNKNYDLFAKGNIGAEGEDGIIRDLENQKDAQILILKDEYKKNWQTPMKVIEYVKKEWRKKESIGLFDIYEY